MGRLSENSVINIKNKSLTVTAEVDIADKPANGVIIAQGGRFGGWSVYAKDGRAKFDYNVLGIHDFPVEAAEPIPKASTQVRMEFAYDGGGLGKGGDVTLYYDGKAMGNGRVGRRSPSSSRPTKRPISATKPAQQSARTTPPRPAAASSPARSTGCS